FGRPALRALAAGVFYGIHPCMVEPVAFVSARFDLLMTTFLLLGLCAGQHIDAWKARATAVAGFFFLATLTKEMAVAFPLVLALSQLCTRYAGVAWRDLRQALAERGEGMTYGLMLVAAIFNLVMRFSQIDVAPRIDDAVSSSLLVSPWRRLVYVAYT